MRLLVLACLLGLSLAASVVRKPHHCKSPPLLTGEFSVSTQNEQLWLFAGYEYDAFGQRIRLYEVGSYQNQSYTYDVLLLFSKGVMYEIDSKASKCEKLPLQGDFQPIGVPPDASLLGQAVLGSSSGPGEGLLVNTWTGQDPTGAKYLVTVTEFGCVPVTTLYQSKDFGWMAISYVNNVDGILDPSALDPPPFCPGQDAEPKGKPMDFFTVLQNIRKNAP